MRFNTSLIFQFVFLLLFPLYSYSDVSVSEVDGKGRIVISGTITPSDYDALVEKISTLKRENRLTSFVFLNSLGGSLETAIKMGRYIRKEREFVVMHEGDICASACVFILAGAISKDVWDGKVFIHRPYWNSDEEDNAIKQKAKYKEIEKIAKTYLEEMNIPTSLYDDMFSISSNASRLLSEDDLRKYRLIGLDPYEEEAVAARMAKELGITKTELHIRQNRLDVICGVQYAKMNQAFSDGSDENTQRAAEKDYQECSYEVMQSK